MREQGCRAVAQSMKKRMKNRGNKDAEQLPRVRRREKMS